MKEIPLKEKRTVFFESPKRGIATSRPTNGNQNEGTWTRQRCDIELRKKQHLEQRFAKPRTAREKQEGPSRAKRGPSRMKKSPFGG